MAVDQNDRKYLMLCKLCLCANYLHFYMFKLCQVSYYNSEQKTGPRSAETLLFIHDKLNLGKVCIINKCYLFEFSIIRRAFIIVMWKRCTNIETLKIK